MSLMKKTLVNCSNSSQKQNTSDNDTAKNPYHSDHNDLQAKYRIRIAGVPEVSSTFKTNERLEYERNYIQDIFNFMGLSTVSTADSFRMGRYKTENERPRSLVVTLTSVWDKNKIIQNSHLLKTYKNKIFISSELTSTEKIVERKLLKKRWELIQSGVARRDLKIRNLKLYKQNELVDTNNI